MSLNKAMIIGNLGRDPEMRYTPSGQAVTQFTVAVNRSHKDQNGEWQEETEWFRVVAWGPLAERTAENLRKGRKVDSQNAEEKFDALKKYARDITEAARDGNASTEPDSQFLSLIPTPPYPTYPGNCVSCRRAGAGLRPLLRT